MVKKHDIPMVDRSVKPINTAENLLFLQDRWVTADVPALFSRLKDIVQLEIEPQEGLLVMEFDPKDQKQLIDTLTPFGCQYTPLENP